MAEISIGEYAEEKARASGKNTSLSGKYELIDVGEMHGFRATGTWLATGWDLVMIVLTDDHVMVSFELIGDEAIAQEQVLLDTLKTYGESAADGSAGGFLRSDGEQFAIDYPDTYSMMDYGLKDGCAVRMFANAGDPNNLYMARTYILDQEYSDALAPSIASMGLPKSAKVEAEPEMVRIGSRNAAVILGNTEAGPLAFYVIGSGRTALAVLFMGEEATGMAEQIMASAEIK